MSLAAAAPAPGSDGWVPELVALDVDGTLSDYDGRISEPVRRMVSRVRERGAHVVLATGRSVLATRPIAETLGLDAGLMVCSNGAVLAGITPPVVLEATTFDPSAAVRALLELAPDTLVAVEDVGRGYLVTEPFPDGELMGEQTVCPLAEMMGRPVTKVVLRRPDSTPEAFFTLVEQAGLHGVNYAIGYSAWLDVLPRNVSKASTLERVRRQLGVASSATLAVGDGRNDLEMLAWAGWSVAMGNASPEVQDAADEVAWPVTEDGLVRALARWFPPLDGADGVGG
ncbi:MAG TPA: HAD family hydrolase [Actinomycetes bacterium]|nr:HAD family hydrolase [Actinomycetes bacterium]